MRKHFYKVVIYLALFIAGTVGAFAAPTTQTFSIKPDSQDIHLQYKALLLTNKDIYPASLYWQLSDNMKGKIQACQAGDKSCDFQSTCATTIAPHSTCKLWLKSIDNNTTPLGNISGQVRIIMTDANHHSSENDFNVRFHNYLYAVGAGRMSPADIVRWDGKIWSFITTEVKFNFFDTYIIYKGDLIVAGGFDAVKKNNISRNIAGWNGATWFSLGQGLTGDGADAVQTLTIYRGKLIAGGWFDHAGAIATNNIAQWDGSKWSSLGAGTDDEVYASAIYNDHLIVGGQFTRAGWDPSRGTTYIAQWDGMGWSTLGGGASIGKKSSVNSLLVLKNHLIIGGYFSQVGGETVNNIAEWDGSRWSSLGVGLNGYVNTLVNFKNNLVAGGYFTVAGGNPANYIAQWNGLQWAPLGDGVKDTQYHKPIINSLIQLGNNMIVGGFFDKAGDVNANEVAQWNGSQWDSLRMQPTSIVENLTVASALNIENQTKK